MHQTNFMHPLPVGLWLSTFIMCCNLVNTDILCFGPPPLHHFSLPSTQPHYTFVPDVIDHQNGAVYGSYDDSTANTTGYFVLCVCVCVNSVCVCCVC